MLIRQAHPGPGHPTYRSFEEKFADAERYAAAEALPWPLLVDDYEGTVHHAYEPLSDPTYLIDVDGRLSFYEKWTSAAPLHEAIEALFAQGGHGVVGSGLRRRMQLGPAMTDGWRAIARGLPQSAKELNRAAPGSTLGLRMGEWLKPLIGPITLRSKPLPVRTRLAIGAAAIGIAAFAANRMRRSA